VVLNIVFFSTYRANEEVIPIEDSFIERKGMAEYAIDI
jgi:hypothetical protein